MVEFFSLSSTHYGPLKGLAPAVSHTMHADDASPTPNCIPECNLSKQELIDEIARLQQELSKYTSREKWGARAIDDKAFRALTGFYNAVEAEREYGLSVVMLYMGPYTVMGQ